MLSECCPCGRGEATHPVLRDVGAKLFKDAKVKKVRADDGRRTASQVLETHMLNHGLKYNLCYVDYL